MTKYVTASEAETIALARYVALQLPENAVLCFFGDLGAGKTTFIRGLVSAFGRSEQVSSPTFVYLNIYKGSKPIYHFDLYRLRDSDEFLSMGFDEYLYAGGICCIEWSERIASLLPTHCIQIHMAHLPDSKREIQIDL